MGPSDWAPRWARLPYLTMQQVYTGPSVRRLADFGAQAEGWSERAGQDWKSCCSAWSDFWRARAMDAWQGRRGRFEPKIDRWNVWTETPSKALGHPSLPTTMAYGKADHMVGELKTRSFHSCVLRQHPFFLWGKTGLPV